MENRLQAAKKNNLSGTITVKNTGSVTGTEIVQMYVEYEITIIERSAKQLCGFTRLTLQPGKEKTCTITCPLDKLRYYDPKPIGKNI